jgi:ADP-ribose pyrophosphatase YjhB (NUDIX family)
MTDCTGTHPGTATFAVWAPDGRFLLVKRAKPGSGYGTWSVPGGRVERGEEWESAARRELHEETGVTVRETVLLTVTTTAGADAGWLTIWNMGRAGSRDVTLNSEGSEYEWVTCGGSTCGSRTGCRCWTTTAGRRDCTQR